MLADFPRGLYRGRVTTWWARLFNLVWFGKRFEGLDVVNNLLFGNAFRAKAFREGDGFIIHYPNIGVHDRLTPRAGGGYDGVMQVDALPRLVVRFRLDK